MSQKWNYQPGDLKGYGPASPGFPHTGTSWSLVLAVKAALGTRGITDVDTQLAIVSGGFYKSFIHVIVKLPPIAMQQVIDQQLSIEVESGVAARVAVGVQFKVHFYSDEHPLSDEAKAAWVEVVLERQGSVDPIPEWLQGPQLVRMPGESDEAFVIRLTKQR